MVGWVLSSRTEEGNICKQQGSCIPAHTYFKRPGRPACSQNGELNATCEKPNRCPTDLKKKNTVQYQIYLVSLKCHSALHIISLQTGLCITWHDNDLYSNTCTDLTTKTSRCLHMGDKKGSHKTLTNRPLVCVQINCKLAN